MKSLFRPIIAFLLLCFAIPGISQVPAYNSYPSAAATIFLDFDGHFVTGTSWNSGGDISCAPSNLTPAQMTEIFNRVSEDYRPFNVNVTTDSAKYLAAPLYKRMRVILTVTSSWYGSAGGVSYIGSFTWGNNTPSFVFTALLNYNTKNIAEATAHEIGHTLGLSHQSSWDGNCTKLSEYNLGNGTGEIGWAPIMGNSYYKNMTLWNNGANPYGCTAFQDDLGIIAGNFGFRPDDHAGTTASATETSFSNNQFNASGVIEQISDNDMFHFTIPAFGSFHLDAAPYNIGSGDVGSNLDMQVELMSADQTVLGTYNPADLLSATIDTVLNSGDYYLRVQGKGNVYAPEYASLGSYSLNGTFVQANVLPVHQLELHGSNQNNKHVLDWIVKADETITAQSLEVSTDGRNFAAVGSPSNSARTFSYVPATSGLLYYRLKIKLDNNQENYSNVISLRSNSNHPKPSLVSNLVHGVVAVNSPAAFTYSITDYSGRIVAKGKLSEGLNNISSVNFSGGMYLIRISTDHEEYLEKFMKQ